MNNGLFIDVDGNKYWYHHDKLHCEGGPAVEYVNGDRHWYLNGKHHREDGPAVEWADGAKFWYLNGKEINCSSQEEFERLLKLKVFW